MTKKRQYLCLVIILALILTACAWKTQLSDGVSVHGQLKVSDGKLKDCKGDVYQLRGLSTHGIAWFPEYITEETFASVKQAGANVIRIAMYTDTENGYLADPESNMTLMLQAIEYARLLDMYVIVDWHILSDGDPNENVGAAIQFFNSIASYYPEDPAIIYEICNEPNGVTWESICEYAEAVFPVIRKQSPNAVIILGTPSYSGDLSDPLLSPFYEENLLYAFHFYAGQHENYELLKYAVENNFPVMVSEWGINCDESNQPALEDGEEFVSYLNQEGISWCAWSLCNKDEVFSILQPECEAISDWKDEDMTDVGRIIFEKLDGGTE